jgi:hypothetical protein
VGDRGMSECGGADDDDKNEARRRREKINFALSLSHFLETQWKLIKTFICIYLTG